MSTPETLITTEFNAASTAAEVVAGLDLRSVRAVVTGASSGIEIETARALAGAGAEVALAVRNVEAGKNVAQDISESTGNNRVFVVPLDLADRPSIAAFVKRWNGPLHLLINNAGVIPSTLQRTVEGWEMQFATNYLGHFALSLGLHDALASGFRERGEARIVSLTSGAHLRSPIVFDDIQFERREYDPQAAYAQSKTADSLFAVEASRRWFADGIAVNAVNPGGVSTGLQRDFTQKQKDYLAEAEAAGVFVYKTPQQGAATTLVAAVAPQFAHTGGHYLTDCSEARTVPDDAELFKNGDGVKQWAINPDEARRLWAVSLELIGVPTMNTFVVGEGKYIRQSSSADSYGHVVLRLEPIDLPENLPIRWEVPPDLIPDEFRNAVIAGIEESLGEWGEDHSQRFLVAVTGGRYHEIDSHNRAFRTASSLAMQDALEKWVESETS